MPSTEKSWRRKKLLSRVRYRWILARKYGLYFLFAPTKQAASKYQNYKTVKKYGRTFLKKRQQIKRKLIKRDGKKCQWCLKKKRDEELTIDHMVERAKGGTNSYSNLRLLCIDCHRNRNNLEVKLV